MAYFGTFYLDKEKDIIVTLDRDGDDLFYTLRTPNHTTGNLISNLASLCHLPVVFDENHFKMIHGKLPCYIDGENRQLWIMRLASTKVASVYPDGTIERKAYIPAIAKTLMSQTKDYRLSAQQTIVKTYIRKEYKFRSDLHTHMSANLTPDVLIAMGIVHQLRYPLYYVRKLSLHVTEEQKRKLQEEREKTALSFQNSSLKGKYLDRRINDNTFINFADLILNNPADASYNIPRIRASLAVMKDGQAVFTNLEKVYLYRYVFTKGTTSEETITLHDIDRIPDPDIVRAVRQMLEDDQNPVYEHNSLYQDELLWIARTYQKAGISYVEISDTSLVKKKEAGHVLKEIHAVMPAVTAETGVTIRFLAALRRIPLTIVKDQVAKGNYFTENLQVLKAVANDPYVAGSDFVGEEINDIRELKPVIQAVVSIAKDIPSYTVRIHAGENDSLPDNVSNSIACVAESLTEGQKFPHMRIGHGLYTANLHSEKGRQLIDMIRKNHVVLEFQISSNVRLNNLNSLRHHPLKTYLKAGIACVQGTDGGALYGTDSIDEQLSLERMLKLNEAELCQMRNAEKNIIAESMQGFEDKKQQFEKDCQEDVEAYYQKRITQEADAFLDVEPGERKNDSHVVFRDRIQDLPADRIPVVIAGGSFNNASHHTVLRKEECQVIDRLLKDGDPERMFFVVGSSLRGYEKYLIDQNRGKFQIFVFVPAAVTDKEMKKIRKAELPVRVSIESSPMGIYKSIAFEIFKRRQSVIAAFDGNSTCANLIQDAKNSKYKSRTFISSHSRTLKEKAVSLEGYVTICQDETGAEEILRYVNDYYENLGKPLNQILKKNRKLISGAAH